MEEVFSHRNEIPPGATLELKVFEETRPHGAPENGQTTSREAAHPAKQLRGRGMLAGILSSEEFLRRVK